MNYYNGLITSSFFKGIESLIQNCDDGQTRLALREVMHQIRFISLKEFTRMLKQANTSFLKNLKNEIPTVLVARGKSNEWVANLAEDLLKVKWDRRDLGDRCAAEYVQDNRLAKNVVLFDDASFSGTQMCAHVEAIVRKLKQFGKGGNIHVVVPFMTKVAEGKLRELQNEAGSQIQIHIAKHCKIPTLKELIQPSHFDLLRKFFGENKKRFPEYDDSGIALTYFQHKQPNDMSFLPSIRKVQNAG